MLTSKQPVLRNFWYATEPIRVLGDGPRAFRLMGEDIVLFLDGDGRPVALRDRCCHRTARLSKGWCDKGNIVCGYHGWSYDRTGALIGIPQYPGDKAIPKFGVDAFHCEERYGYAWVCLGEPMSDIPEIAEDADPSYRRIAQFHDVWRTSPLRFMENSFDNAHFSFVHKGTFGQMEQPVPGKYRLTETDYGFDADATVEIRNPPSSHRVTGTDTEMVDRHLRNRWFLPFCRRLDIEYPGGLRHIIFNCATPIDDESIYIAQILYRNDREEDCSTAELIAWDRAIIEEDREILESTDPDAPLNAASGEEGSMISDHPGLIIRKQLLKLLRDNDEIEMRSSAPRPSVFRDATADRPSPIPATTKAD
ncbi:MAG: aromatic ring-hydroxylating dioxygenase subunit alpha [Pseudomonadota bacterium]